MDDEQVITENEGRAPEGTPDNGAKRDLTPAARRALEEARQRREAEEAETEQPKELGGQAGPEPTRYGDWERKGVISDF